MLEACPGGDLPTGDDTVPQALMTRVASLCSVIGYHHHNPGHVLHGERGLFIPQNDCLP